MVTLDKPATDGALVRYHLRLKGSTHASLGDLDLSSTEIVLVKTEEECSAAVEALRGTEQPIAFDSEYVPLPKGTKEKTALVQLCASNDKVYIFEVRLFLHSCDLTFGFTCCAHPPQKVHSWDHCYESFALLMSDGAARKVAHFIGACRQPTPFRCPSTES